MKRKGRADGRVEVKVTLPDGSRKSIYGKTKSEAKYLAEKYKAQNLYGFLPGDVRDETVESWCEKWLDAYVRGTIRENSYVAGYENPLRIHILPRFGKRTVNTVSQMDVQKFLNELSSAYKRNTVRKIQTCLSKMFAAAVANHVCRDNPVSGTKISAPIERPVKRFYDRETVDKIAAFDHPYTHLIRLMLECGLRREELFGLQWQDIQPDGVHVVRVVPTVHGQPMFADPKTQASARTVPISDALREALKNARKTAKVRKDTEYLLRPKKGGGVINPHHFGACRLATFYRAFSKEYGLDNFPVLSPHEHRHTCGTLLYRETRDIYKVMTFLGHSSVEVTASVYVHPDTEKGISYKDYIRA